MSWNLAGGYSGKSGAGSGGENVLTFTSGATRTVDTITIDLITGLAGGQTIIGGTATTDALTYKTTTGVGTTGADHIFVVGSNGATEAMRILNNTFVGFGTPTPETAIHVVSSLTTSPRGIMSAQYNTGGDGARFHGRKSRGTLSSPTIVVSGDNLVRFVGSGYDGASFLEMTSIDCIVSGTVGINRVPTSMTFSTATDTATSVLTKKVTILPNGNTGFGHTDPTTIIEAKGYITASNNATECGHAMNRVNGTRAAPTPLVATNVIGNVGWGGQYDTTVGHLNTGAYISVIATGAWSSLTNSPADVLFYTASTTEGPTERTRLTSTGKSGFGVSAPTAFIHIKAGSAVAGTSPLKLSSGPVLTTPEAGSFEFLKDKLYFDITTGPTRKEVQLYDTYYGEAYFYTPSASSATAMNIDTTLLYHAVVLATTAGNSAGFTHLGGQANAIASVAENATAVSMLVTTTGNHGLTTGQIVTHTGLNTKTAYRGAYVVQSTPTPTTYVILGTFTGSDTGFMKRGFSLQANAGSAGVYRVEWTISAECQTNTTEFKFEVNANTTAKDNIAAEEWFVTANECHNISSAGLLSIADGDYIWLSVANLTDASDVSYRHCNLNLSRV
jgi:hypothetical protein